MIIEPDVGSYSRFDSKKVEKFYEEGYRSAQNALPQIKKFLKTGKRLRLKERLIQSFKNIIKN
jgi:hypothetical protein